MQKLSDRQIRGAFQDKFRDFEIEVPDESSSLIFDALRKQKTVHQAKQFFIIVLVLLTALCPLFLQDTSDFKTLASTASLPSIATDAPLPGKKRESDSTGTTQVKKGLGDNRSATISRA